MAKFSYNSGSNSMEGSNIPLGRKLKRQLFNLKVSLFRNESEEEASVFHAGRAIK